MIQSSKEKGRGRIKFCAQNALGCVSIGKQENYDSFTKNR